MIQPAFNIKLFSAIGLHLVVLLCWVAYTFYQPKIFFDFGFSDLSLKYIKIQYVLLILIPPISGLIVDSFFLRKGKVILFILITIMITACIFLLSAGIFLSSSNNLIPVIPYLMMFWVISMNLFYSPGLAIISKSAEATGWAFASGVTGAITDLVYSIIPLAILFFSFLGRVPTFSLGAALLFLLYFLFTKYHKQDDALLHESKNKPSFIHLLIAFIIGSGLGYIHYHVLHLSEYPFIPVSHSLSNSLIMVIVAISIVFLHRRLHKIGFLKCFGMGFMITLAAYFIQHNDSLLIQILSCLLMIVGLIGVTGSAFGAALEKVSRNWHNTATGLLLSGFNLMAIL